MISEKLSQISRTMKSSMIRELVASTRDIEGLISFAGGFPSPKTFPAQILADLYAKVLRDEGSKVLQYGASEGDTLLKKELLKWEGYDIPLDQMLITAGATNAIYYITRTLIDPGDVIICEAPSFLGSLVAFEATGAELVGVSLDTEGIDISLLQSKVDELLAKGKKVKLIYTIPDFHNPAGLSMSYSRRKALIEYALAMQIPILEDNPYSRLRYMGTPLPTLYKIATEEYLNNEVVTEVVSFSKILGPGLRLAFAKGSKTLIERMCSWQQKINIAPDNISQRVAGRFLAEGYMDPHIQMCCDFYRPYLQSMLEAMAKHLPSYIQYTKPEGGIFTWLRLPEDMNADKLFEQAKARKVTFIPGSKFYPTGQEKFNALRLNYSFCTPQQIDEGIRSLGEIMNEFYA
ncbi:MAG: PLP-dependent aminotransferase family protein [Candidatus Cloacimonetes bacterium]|nr:PLP-dependent aminotransferase family protein [Candidatus Cloacimonadota bacterium]